MADGTRIALGISASGTLSCAMLAEGQMLTHASHESPRSAGLLATLVEKLLKQVDAKPEQIKEVRVDIGPGSYTGLRAALAFAQIAGNFAGASLFTATSAELVAIAALETGLVDAGDSLLSLRDGTRKLVLRTELRVAERVAVSDAPRAHQYHQLIESIRPEHIILADAGLRTAVRARIEELDCKVLTAPDYGAVQLFSPRLAPRSTPIEGLEPLYLMGSYAE